MVTLKPHVAKLPAKKTLGGKHPGPKPRITEECTIVEVLYPKCAIPISEARFARISKHILDDLRSRISNLHRRDRPGRLFDTGDTLPLELRGGVTPMANMGCELVGTIYKYCKLVPGGPLVYCKCDKYLCPDGSTYEICIQSSK